MPPARDPSDASLSGSPVPESPPAAGAGRVAASTVTLYDVARLAGVSTATVSRVLHGQDRVRDSTRARVREVIDQLGYVPDSAAQSLSRRQKSVIGLVCVERLAPHQYDIESMSLLFYDEILRGVEAAHPRSQLVAADYLPARGKQRRPRPAADRCPARSTAC